MVPQTIEISDLVSAYFRVLNEDTTEFKSQKRYLPTDHYENNQKEIGQLLDTHGANIKTAVVLGPGFCDDIPLEKLAAHCTQVAMMDIDRKTLETVIKKLPTALQGKVVPVVCDLSGVMNYFMSCYASMPRNITVGKAQQIYDDVLRKAVQNRGHLPAPDKYDLVISSMMANQLSAQSQNFVKELLERMLNPKERKTLSPVKQSTEYEKFRDWVTKNHLQHIEDLAKPKGIIYFSDQMYGRDTCFENDNIVMFERYHVQTLDVRAKLFLQFRKVISQNEWEWDIKLPKTDPETGELELGSRMTVRSYAYHPGSTLH